MTIGQAIDLHYPKLFSKILDSDFISSERISEIDIIQQKNEAELEIMSTIIRKMTQQK